MFSAVLVPGSKFQVLNFRFQVLRLAHPLSQWCFDPQEVHQFFHAFGALGTIRVAALQLAAESIDDDWHFMAVATQSFFTIHLSDPGVFPATERSGWDSVA